MAIINTDPKADTAYVIFTIIFIVFGLAFTRSPFSKNYITMWVLLSFRLFPVSFKVEIGKVIEKADVKT